MITHQIIIWLLHVGATVVSCVSCELAESVELGKCQQKKTEFGYEMLATTQQNTSTFDTHPSRTVVTNNHNHKTHHYGGQMHARTC